MPHPLSGTVGHIVPTARGGTDDPDNLRVEHWYCNMRKGSYLDEELDPKSLAPPSEIIDVVAYLAARQSMIAGGRRGGYRLKELRPNVAHLAGLNPNSLAALATARTRDEHQNSASDKGGWSLVHKNNPGKAHEWGKLGSFTLDQGRHTRWHVSRGVINPLCQLCRPNFIDLWEGANASSL